MKNVMFEADDVMDSEIDEIQSEKLDKEIKELFAKYPESKEMIKKAIDEIVGEQ